MEGLELNRAIEAQRDLVKARDWEQFHTPKNLAAALSVESSELLEIFQWMTDAESNSLSEAKLINASDEIADVLYYVIRLADVLKIDLNKAFWNKLEKSKEKYPVEKSKGNAIKYTDFQEST